jgi:hypothetical protein
MVSVPSLLAVVLLGAPLPHAQQQLAEARALYAGQRFSEARARLQALESDASLPASVRVEALELLATSELALNLPEEAVNSFAGALAVDPLYAPHPDSSPKILRAWEAARAQVFPRDYVRLQHLPGPPGVVRFQVVDPWARVAELAWVENRGGSDRRPRPVTRHDRGVASVHVGVAEGVAGWVEARATDGSVLAQLGSADQPLRVAKPGAFAGPAAGPFPAPPPTDLDEGGALRRRTGSALAAAGVLAAAAGVALQARAGATFERARAQDWADDALRLREEGRTEQRWGFGLLAGGVTLGAAAAITITW